MAKKSARKIFRALALSSESKQKEMKLPGLGIPMQDKVPAYLALSFFLVMLAMILLNFPPVLQEWGGDMRLFAHEFRTGIVGIIFFLIIAIWVYFHRDYYRQNKSERMRVIALFFAFFFNALSSFVVLGITSNGFKINPESVEANLRLYHTLHDIQFYVFITVAVVLILWFVRNGMFNVNKSAISDETS